jgi:hypothetical protein
MTSRGRFAAVVVVLIGVLAGCDSATAIPGGAQQVHVDATGATVRLDPATVRAGDVYLVVDLPAGGASLALLEETGGSMSDADLARLTQAGDQQGGKVHKETLAAGKYAFILHADSLRPGVPPPAVTVLQVTP